jgi:tetratricopeptide (TPR) repeat protein
MAEVIFKGLQIQKAAGAFEKALQLDPKNVEAALKLSELYLYIKAYPKCVNYANEALKIDRSNAKAYFLKGFAYKETGDTSKALSSFQTAVEVQPDHYDAYIQLGNIQAARRNLMALQYYNNALRLRPHSTEALYNRGLFLQESGNLDAAIKDYETILKIDPRYEDAHYNLGYIDLVIKKDYTSAISHFSDAIRINDQYVEAYYNRGLAYEFSGNPEAAQKDYHAALKVVPTYKPALKKIKS